MDKEWSGLLGKSTTVICEICKMRVGDLGDHLFSAHNLDLGSYLLAVESAVPKTGDVKRTPPSEIEFMGKKLPWHKNVPPEVCLAPPPKYREPSDKESPLYRSALGAFLSYRKGRSVYVWGQPGSGKDALWHAISALSRRPALMLQISPEVDIQSWFFTRTLTPEGSGWEEGLLLKALRDGYVTEKGEVIPYMVLFSDLDRASAPQAESLRLVMDSIQGRVAGPRGETYPLLEGTSFVATGNTAGGRDIRGRMSSVQLMDASLLDRWDRVFEFEWMSWVDEEQICIDKFPELHTRCPNLFKLMGKFTDSIRHMIRREELYAEFSHRSVTQVLGYISDLIGDSEYAGEFEDKTLLEIGLSCWLPRLPDLEDRQAVLSCLNVKSGSLR